MTEPTNAQPPPAVPPPLPGPAENAPPAAKGAWGFWPTVGWSAIIACAYLVVQISVVVVYAIGLTVMNKGRSLPPMNEVASDGSVMGVALILCTLPVVVYRYCLQNFGRARSCGTIWHSAGRPGRN